MKAQVANKIETIHQSVIGQLLEIAKVHNAMDVIGGSTSWRWQEGLITRMPKAKTVAAILSKAFRSDDPRAWVGRVDGELKKFIENTFSVSEQDSLLIKKIEDKYECLFLIVLSDNGGTSIDQLIFQLSLFKYAEVFSDEYIYFKDLDENLVISINGDWAKKRIIFLMDKYNLVKDENDLYKLGEEYEFSSSVKNTMYIRELEILRLRIVGHNSHFDMWRFHSRSLTDRESIYIERRMLAYYETLMNEIDNIDFSFDLNEEKTRKCRCFSLSVMTIPNRPEEQLKCNY